MVGNQQDPNLPKRKTPAHLPPRHNLSQPCIIFVTTCTQARKPILDRPEIHQLLVETWIEASAWMVGRYVVMPDHIHLFCSPASWESPSLNTWIHYWKSVVSRRWPHPKEKPLWQKSFWDRQLRSGEHYASKWDYVFHNPVRKGLVKDPQQWPYQGEVNVFDWHE